MEFAVICFLAALVTIALLEAVKIWSVYKTQKLLRKRDELSVRKAKAREDACTDTAIETKRRIEEAMAVLKQKEKENRTDPHVWASLRCGACGITARQNEIHRMKCYTHHPCVPEDQLPIAEEIPDAPVDDPKKLAELRRVYR